MFTFAFSLYMLTCKHSEVCILKTHVHMLAYEVNLLHLKLIKYLSQSIFCMFSILYQVRVITVFTVFRLLTDFVCLYNYEF
jgi:hypothetical protein